MNIDSLFPLASLNTKNPTRKFSVPIMVQINVNTPDQWLKNCTLLNWFSRLALVGLINLQVVSSAWRIYFSYLVSTQLEQAVGWVVNLHRSHAFWAELRLSSPRFLWGRFGSEVKVEISGWVNLSLDGWILFLSALTNLRDNEKAYHNNKYRPLTEYLDWKAPQYESALIEGRHWICVMMRMRIMIIRMENPKR